MKCCICGKTIKVEFNGWDQGHNAQPIMEGRCCEECNVTKVIPARMIGVIHQEDLE